MSLGMYKDIGNGVGALTSALKIAISNASNFNSPGFKYTYASFMTQGNAVLSGATTTTDPIELGASMTIGSTSTDFSQGNITIGTGLDNAIVGEGFFVLSKTATDTSSSGEKVFSRAGHFQLDFQSKYLTDSIGRVVYGYKLDDNGNITSRTLVPIQTDGNADVGFEDGGVLVSNFQKNKDDITSGSTTPTKTKPLYRLALTTFSDKQGLIGADGNAFESTVASGQPMDYGVAGEGAYGTVKGSSLESSNIDVAKVALDMALLNRGFSAVQGLIDDLNKILSGLISKLQ